MFLLDERASKSSDPPESNHIFLSPEPHSPSHLYRAMIKEKIPNPYVYITTHNCFKEKKSDS